MDLLDRFKFLDAHFNGEETKHDITELRNEVMKYPTCSIESAKVDCSSDASRIMRKKGINKEN